MAVSDTELILHGILFIVAALTPIIIYVAYSKFNKGDVKTIVKLFLISYFFSALRWAGGSLARLDIGFTNTLTYNVIWTLTGIIAAVTGIFVAKKLLDFANEYGFK